MWQTKLSNKKGLHAMVRRPWKVELSDSMCLRRPYLNKEGRLE